MNKSGVKGNTQQHQVGRELNREKKRGEYTEAKADSTQESTIKGDPFTSSARRQVSSPSSMGMGKDRICSDHRSDCLISDSNPTLDHHADRMDEHGGFKANTEKGPYKQGNILDQNEKFKMNPNASVR